MIFERTHALFLIYPMFYILQDGCMHAKLWVLEKVGFTVSFVRRGLTTFSGRD